MADALRALVLLAVVAIFTHNLALAQGIDPRVVKPAVEMLNAEIAYRDAVLKALADDQVKREKDLADWFRGWFGAPDAGK